LITQLKSYKILISHPLNPLTAYSNLIVKILKNPISPGGAISY